MNTDLLDIVCDKNKLQKELIFYSLFLMVFENFVSNWIDLTRSFFSNGFAIDDITGEHIDFIKRKVKDGKVLFVKDNQREREYNTQVFHRVKRNGKNNPKLSLFQWMVDSNLINLEDFVILDKCYSKRNEYAHNISKCLNHYVSKEEKDLLKSLIAISEKAAKNWILEFELPTSTPKDLAIFIDDEGNYNPPDEVISGTQLFYSLVLNNLNDIFNE